MAYVPERISEDELINHLPETVGQVSLNYDFYPGSDLYSDGDIEDRLLEIVRSTPREAYRNVYEEACSWPILYHLSEIRGNIVDFLPISKEDKVLEIGSGCGAITQKLAEKAKSVTCVDLSARRSLINANRNEDRENIKIYVGNFNDIEPHLDTDYDYVMLIGVFEYGASYIPTKTPYEDFLKIIMKHVRKEGRAVIAIENKFGLKYWGGCPEDHNGEFFSSLEGYPNGGSARTFTRQGLEKIFKACLVEDYHFYYPYPDYKLPDMIFSDKRLPHIGELTDNRRALDRNRMILFDEDSVFDSAVSDGLFPVFSNSYLAILGPDVDVQYAKYSNDRSEDFMIKTVITDTEVLKEALSPQAVEHIFRMKKSYELLTKRYEGSELKINPCTLSEDGIAHFPIEKGRTLEEIMDEAVFSGDTERFNQLFEEYYKRISFNSGVEITDYDLIFANILVDGDNWTVIDYEWTYEKTMDDRQIAFRALYCYFLENARRVRPVDLDYVLGFLGSEPEEFEDYREKEEDFQKEITGHRKSLGEINATIGTNLLDAKELHRKELKRILDERIQVYFDFGNGFSEENSTYIPDVYVETNHVSTDIEFDGNTRLLRIDPADTECVVRINELLINGENILNNRKVLETNGKALKYGTYAFSTKDPNITIKLNEVLIKGENVLHIDMEVIPVSTEMVSDISASVKKLF